MEVDAGIFSRHYCFMKSLVVLGSTGSIGVQTLDVARAHDMKILGISGNSNVELLERQAREFGVKYVCIADEARAGDIKTRLADTDVTVLSGTEGLCELAAVSCDAVVNAVVGMVGLTPTLAALRAGNDVALANKETLVVGGLIVNETAEKYGRKIIPIDSEHSAIFQCLMGNNGNRINKILLTASGGPFFGYTKEMLRTVTKEQALKHPNWSMGQKITTDSATLMNKGLELIEAVRLFGVQPSQVEVVVHRQSIIHSAVEFEDGAVMAQLGVPDMRIPIQLALTYPKRLPSPSKRLSLFETGTMTFERADEDTFVCLALARDAIGYDGNAPCILNAANEAAVGLFLQDKISFYQISELVELAYRKIERTKEISLDIIGQTERETRSFVEGSI